MPGDLKSASMLWYLRGFHVYPPTVGEVLATQREHGNPEDAYHHVLIISASFNISDWRLAL